MIKKANRISNQNNAVIYCRVSTAEQVSNLSLETQERTCRELCARQGLTVKDIFIEKGESAKTINRTKFQEMLAYCAKNKGIVSAIVVHSCSRFARNAGDHHAVRVLLAGYGIKLISVTETFDDSAQGKMFEGIHAVFAQYENDNRSDRTKLGMRQAVIKGRWPFKAPLGYLRSGKDYGCSLRLDPVMAPLLRLAFEMVASGGYTANEAVRKANSLGLRTSKGTKVNPQSFHYTLRKPVYAGWIVVEKWNDSQPVKGDFEPLVDEALFNRVQQILLGKRVVTKTHARSNPDFPLRRFVKCGHCSSSLTGSWSKGRKDRYGYYRCTKCKQVNVRKEELEDAFISNLECLKPKQSLLRLFEAVVMDVWHKKQAEAVAQIASHEGQLTALLEKKDRLFEACFYDKRIDDATYKRQESKLQEEIVIQQIALNELKIDGMEIETVIAFARNLLENASNLWLKAPLQQREKLQKVLFPEGLTYKEGKLGTTVTGSAFNFLQQSAERKSSMATRHGFEP